METNDTSLNVQEIVKRAKEAKKFRTDLELAQYLGIARSTLSNWMTRNSIDYPVVLEKMKEGGRKERFIRLHESLNPWTIKNKIAQYAKEIAMLLSLPQP